MCNMYKITTTRYFEVSRTISTGKIQHPPNTSYPMTNTEQKFAPRRSVLFLREHKHGAGQGGWIALSKATGRTSEESWFESRQIFILSQNRPSSLWDLPRLLFTEYRVLFPWPHSDKDMKHTAHPYLLPGQITRTMPRLRLHIFTTWIGILYLPTSQNKTKEGYEIRLHRLGDNIPTGRVNCMQFGSLNVAVSQHARKK